jgi:hypothetical protein
MSDLESDLVEQMASLIRGMATDDISVHEAFGIAKGIASSLPKPVDPDWETAGAICEDYGFGKKSWDRRGDRPGNYSSQDVAFVALKKGRELQKAEA